MSELLTLPPNLPKSQNAEVGASKFCPGCGANQTGEVKERKKYIPPMSHPWKLESFKKQLQRSHYKHQYA